MKKEFIRSIGLLALLAVFVIIPTAAFAAGVRVVLLPWKVNSAENLDYIRDALPEMLASRLGTGGTVEVVAADEVKDVLAGLKAQGVTDKVAMEAGVRLKADYVVYGSPRS
jgi:outer membrane protein insertion porin family